MWVHEFLNEKKSVLFIGVISIPHGSPKAVPCENAGPVGI